MDAAPQSFDLAQDACSSWQHYGQDIHHNDTVRCKSLSAMRGRDVIGRVVQVRLGCGQFGSDMVLLRMADGQLQSVENEWFEKCDSLFPPTSYDTAGDTYTIGERWPESGFIVVAPKQPQSAGSFSIIIAKK